jgi:hypothetical protein
MIKVQSSSLSNGRRSRIRFREHRVLCVGAVLAAAGCSGGSDSAAHTDSEPAGGNVAPAAGTTLQGAGGEDPYVVCGERVGYLAGAPDGVGRVVKTEGYRFGKLTRELTAAPGLAKELGFGAVTTCESARAVRRALDAREDRVLDELEAAEGSRDLAPDSVDLVAEGESVDVVEKIYGTGTTAVITERAVHLVIYPSTSQIVDPAGSWTCTGTFIRNDLIVTAAHCLPPATTEGAARRIRASAFTHDGSGNWTERTIMGDVPVDDDGNPLIGPTLADSYQKAFFETRGDDIGVIVLDSPAMGLTSDDYAYLYGESSRVKGSTTKFLAYGPRTSNVNTLNMRSGGMVTNSWSGSVVRAKYDNSTNKVRHCDGDSGGPIFWDTVSSRRVLAGVYSGPAVEVDAGTNNCAGTDSNVYWAATDGSMTWLMGVIPNEDCVLIDHDQDIYDCNR